MVKERGARNGEAHVPNTRLLEMRRALRTEELVLNRFKLALASLAGI